MTRNEFVKKAKEELTKFIENTNPNFYIDDSGYIVVRLYALNYLPQGLKELLGFFSFLQNNDFFKKNYNFDGSFSINYDTGYYDSVDEIYLDITPKKI